MLPVAILAFQIAALLPSHASSAGTAAEPDAVDTLLAAEDRYLSLMAADDYTAALPYARRLVELAGSTPGAGLRLASAYCALGTTLLRLNDLAGAESSYARALELTEGEFGMAAAQQARPLAGLGATYAAMDEHELATEYLQRAIGVSRRSQGLMNLEQLDLMNELAASRQALGDDLGVLAVRIHAVTILKQNFGELNPRTLPAVTQLAEHYEAMEEFGFARRAYGQMYRVSSQEGGAGNPDIIKSLLGIARNHRLQFTRAPKSLLEEALYRDPISGQAVPLMSIEPFQGPKLNREGKKSIEEALEALRATDSPPPRSLVAALIELGDWYVAEGKPERALPSYTQAWRVASESLSDEPNPLAVPRLVFYRLPTASKRNAETTTGKIVTHTATFRLLVDAFGVPQNVELESSGLSDVQTTYLRRAVESARYSPRFEAGNPVSAPDTRFVGEWDLIDP